MKFSSSLLIALLLYLPNLLGQSLENITTAYTMNLTDNGVGLCRFNLFKNDSLQLVIATNWDIKASAIQGDKWYGVRNKFPYLPNELVFFDTNAHTVNFITQLNIPIYQTVSGMAWDNSTSSMYVSTWSINATPVVGRLYTIDLQTGDSKFIGEIGNYAVSDIAISKEGILYGVEQSNYKFLKIDKKTGVGTIVGSLGSNVSWPLGLQFNKASGALYLLTYQDSPTFTGAELKVINPKIGFAKLIYTFPGSHLFLDALYINTDAGELQPFNINYPAANQVITTIKNSHELFLSSWDTSRTKATYNFVFGSPTIQQKKFEINFITNNSNITLNGLDSILASLGVQQGDSLPGQWDIWAYRNNWSYDSLASANGPRNITFKRAIPQLKQFDLLSPINGTTINTVYHNTGVELFSWKASGTGVRYMWKFFDEDSSLIFSFQSNNNGLDTNISFINYKVDNLLFNRGLQRGDSLKGRWEVWGFSLNDSLRSLSSYNMVLKRKPIPEILVTYDSLYVEGLIDRDSVVNNLNAMNMDYDLFMHGFVNISSYKMSFRPYKTIIWLGSQSHTYNVPQKDSLKIFLSLSGTAKKNLIVFSNAMAGHLDYFTPPQGDRDFLNNWLGIIYLWGTQNQIIIGDYINNGLRDSLISSTFVNDIIAPHFSSSVRLYKYEAFPGADTSFAIGYKTANYNIAFFCSDIRKFANNNNPGSVVRRMLNAAFSFVEQNTPVELTSFTADVTGNSVVLNWSTASEINNSRFNIERKIPSQDYSTIGFVNGSGTSSNDHNYSFVDKNLSPGFYTYRLKQIDYEGTYKYSNEININVNSPLYYSLEQNYPNPFNPSTTIEYSVPKTSKVKLIIYNILGQEVITSVNEVKEPGRYTLNFNASSLSSGMYIYRITAGKYIASKKMMLVK